VRTLCSVNAGTVLGRARALVHRFRGDGVTCPCCDQLVKVYRRPFNAQMARGLIWLVREHERRVESGTEEWIHVPSAAPGWLLASREFWRCAYWGLIIQRRNDDPTKRTSGYWKPSPQGAAFVHDNARLPAVALIFDGRVLDTEGPDINVVAALGKRFDYRELWETL